MGSLIITEHTHTLWAPSVIQNTHAKGSLIITEHTHYGLPHNFRTYTLLLYNDSADHASVNEPKQQRLCP